MTCFSLFNEFVEWRACSFCSGERKSWSAALHAYENYVHKIISLVKRKKSIFQGFRASGGITLRLVKDSYTLLQ